MTGQRRLGPPAEDPWSSIAPQPPLDDLLERSIERLDETGPALDGLHRFEGRARFDHLALMGPPGRLQGGLHTAGRVFPVLSRVAAHAAARTFPCALNVRLDRPLPLFEPIDFEASYRAPLSEQPGHPGWWLNTRFGEGGRLDATAWSRPDRPLLAATALDRWRERHRAAVAEWDAVADRADREQHRFLGHAFRGTPAWFWERVEPRPRGPEREGSLRRLLHPDGTLGPAFSCYHVDIIAALALGGPRRHPHFTTRVSISIAAERIPPDRPLLCIADRRSRRPDPHSSARPVPVGGEPVGTEVLECLLVDEGFERVHAHGWVACHPVDLARMAEARTTFWDRALAGELGEQTRALAAQVLERMDRA